MLNLQPLTKSVLTFVGDVFICPCDVDLTNSGVNSAVNKLHSSAGDDLLKELAIIGTCQFGNACITKGYNSNIKHFIFYPYFDGEKNKFINFVLLHKAIKSAFDLARLYNLQKIGTFIPDNLLEYDEVLDIIKGNLNEQQNLFVYNL